jgi:hypothetical protein
MKKAMLMMLRMRVYSRYATVILDWIEQSGTQH